MTYKNKTMVALLAIVAISIPLAFAMPLGHNAWQQYCFEKGIEVIEEHFEELLGYSMEFIDELVDNYEESEKQKEAKP